MSDKTDIASDTPYMCDGDIECIERNLKKDDIVIEWGSGGSTLYFPQFVKDYHSIEENLLWFRKTRIMLRKKPFKDKVHIYNVENNIKEYYHGQPDMRDFHRNMYTDYIEKIDELGIDKFDVVFVDGEFGSRDYCAMYSRKYMHKDSLLIFHDWYRKQPINVWPIIDKYFYMVDKHEEGEDDSSSVAIFKQKEDMLDIHILSEFKNPNGSLI